MARLKQFYCVFKDSSGTLTGASAISTNGTTTPSSLSTAINKGNIIQYTLLKERLTPKYLFNQVQSSERAQKIVLKNVFLSSLSKLKVGTIC